MSGVHKITNRIFKYSDGSYLSYRSVKGSLPGVFYMHGTQSSIDSTKALFVQNYCQEKGIAFTSFNFRGHGDSSGDYKDATISIWLHDALSIMDNIATGKQLLIGSSMGGWIMLLLAMRRPDRVKALLGLSAAPDFTTMIWKALTPDMQREITTKGFIETLEGEYHEIWSLALLQDGNNNLVLNHPIPVNAPVVLMHGDKDTSVPLETAFAIKNKLISDDVKLMVIKDATHNLSRAQDLQTIKNVINEILFPI